MVRRERDHLSSRRCEQSFDCGVEALSHRGPSEMQRDDVLRQSPPCAAKFEPGTILEAQPLHHNLRVTRRADEGMLAISRNHQRTQSESANAMLDFTINGLERTRVLAWLRPALHVRFMVLHSGRPPPSRT